MTMKKQSKVLVPAPNPISSLNGKIGKAADGSMFLSFEMPKAPIGLESIFSFINPVYGGSSKELYLKVLNSDEIRGVIILFKKLK